MTGDVAAIDPKLTRLEDRVGQLSGQLEQLQASLNSLTATVKDATEHFDDTDHPGILTRARDALSGAGATS